MRKRSSVEARREDTKFEIELEFVLMSASVGILQRALRSGHFWRMRRRTLSCTDCELCLCLVSRADALGTSRDDA